jgi:hypothetical protein
METLGADGTLEIGSLHERHSGLLEVTALDMYAAARVAIARYHNPPEPVWNVQGVGPAAVYACSWERPTPIHLRTFANEIDTTELAAYCIAIATADTHLGLEVIRRAAQGSGSDWIVAPQGSPVDEGPDLDLERTDLMRLEVSGIGDDTLTKLSARLGKKVTQAQVPVKPLPATAAVVGFRSASVRLRKA